MTMFEGSTDFKPASRPFNAESTVSLADPSQEIVERERLAADDLTPFLVPGISS
jgi:uncharacterized heparinase superfamily protein